MEKTITVSFSEADERIDVTVDALRRAVVSFLDAYGEASLLGPDFTALLEGQGGKADSAAERGDSSNVSSGARPGGQTGGQRLSGQTKFENLLQAAGLDEAGFFR